MIIFDEVEPHAQELLTDLKNRMKQTPIQGFVDIHGTFAGGKKKGLKYVSDIDMEAFVRYTGDNIDQIAQYVKETVLYLIQKQNCYLKELLAGHDDRFVFDFYILKNGTVVGYNCDEIQDHLTRLEQEGVLTADELDELLEYVVPNPSLADFEKLKLKLEPYQTLDWTLDEMKKGKKEQRKKVFDFGQSILTYSVRTAYVWEYKKGEYVSLDLSFRLFQLDVFEPGDMPEHDILKMLQTQAKIVNDPTFGHTTVFLYEGIFKNYVQEKYFKILKRMRSLVTQYIFFRGEDDKNATYEPGREPQHKDLLRNIREEIRQLSTNEEFSCLNQMKNRAADIVALIEYKPEKEIKRLTKDMIKDTRTVCKYENFRTDELNKLLKSKKYNKERLKESINDYKKEVFHRLNRLALPYLSEIWSRISFLFPFQLVFPVPERDRL